MASITGYSTYLPYWRLRRDAIAGVLGGPPAKGTRAVASYDEDTTSMAVEAARELVGSGAHVGSLLFATTAPAYLDKTNAAAVHAALDLPASTFAADLAGSLRSGVAALRSAATAAEPTLVVLSDTRGGLPKGADERDGGDGAAAFLFGSGEGLADLIAATSSTAEVLDRWRLPGETASHTWEERFGEPVYTAAAEQAFTDALKSAGVVAEDVDHLVVTGVHGRAARSLRKSLGVRAEAVTPDLVDVIGNTGAAHPGVLLAGVLDTATPGQLIALVVLADGADVLLLRVGDAIADRRQAVSVREQIETGNDTLRYGDFLTWRGALRLEPPRRPDPDMPMAPPARRSVRWKFALVGSRCLQCGSRFAPPQRVCLDCGAVDDMADERFAGAQGVVRTFTVDRLAFTPNPPMLVAVIDIDGGGRMECEVTDIAGPEDLAVGDRLELTFRRLYTIDGVHNYFWKARPARGQGKGE